MSGGSFDYLHIKETHQVVEMRDDVERMAETLQEAGYLDASTRTRRVLQLIKSIEYIQRELADVWQAVEWWVSSDWGPEQVKTAVEKWRARETNTE